jgi:hypothetical protein
MMTRTEEIIDPEDISKISTEVYYEDDKIEKMMICKVDLDTTNNKIFDINHSRSYDEDYDGKLQLEINLIIE